MADSIEAGGVSQSEALLSVNKSSIDGCKTLPMDPLAGTVSDNKTNDGVYRGRRWGFGLCGDWGISAGTSHVKTNREVTSSQGEGE